MSRSDALAGLWKCSQPALFFQLQPNGEALRKEQELAAWTSNIEESLTKHPYVDYYGGRCIKTDFSTFPKVDLTHFNRLCYKEKDVSEKEVFQKCIQGFSVHDLEFGK